MKFTTIITAAALALTITAGTIHTTDAREHGPRLVIKDHDSALVWDDGRIVQTEYITQYGLERIGLIDCIWFEDGSPKCE